MNSRIICCGNIAFDLISEAGNNPAGPVFYARPGGSVSNTAAILNRLGLSVLLASKTGRDFLGDSLVSTIKNAGIDTGLVSRDKNVRTSLAFAQIDKKGDPSYVFYKPRNLRLSSEKDRIPVTLFKKAAVFHTGSLFSYADHTHETVLKYIKQAKKQNVFISYDPNWRGTRIKDKRTARSRIKALLPRVDLLKLSETDALGLTGRRSLPYALDAIRDISKCEIVVTRGKKGAFYWDGKEQTAHPAFKVNVVDTIGAGDAFTAGLIYRYLAKGKEGFRREKRENLAFASAVSALICAGRGATEGLKNLSQVERFLSREKEQRPLLFP